MSDKKKKIVGRIFVICLIIILLELIIMAVIKVKRERDISRVNEVKDVIYIDNGYVTVGVSDFHNSSYVKEKTYEYTDLVSKEKMNVITTQARIAKYDKNKKLIWENTYENDYDSTFYSVIEVDDGYVAVGSMISKYEQIDAKTRDALIVKFDKSAKMVWKNTYSVLSDTEFFKVIKDDDKLIVIGQSIYENMEMGTHTIGGGIIVSYSLEGEELSHNNYGGNKSGSFNDIIKVDDGYIVCGKDATNYGIVLKFLKDFNREEDDKSLISKKIVWQRTYSNTDTIGFTSMALVNDNLYLAGAINVSNEKDEEGKTIFKYDAGFVIYNLKGKFIEKYNLGEDTHHRFNSIINEDNYLYLSMEKDVDSYYHDGKHFSIIVKYDLNEKKIVDRIVFDEKNDFIINKLVKINNQKMYLGTSDNYCGIFGCDYENIFEYIKEA